jgi:hypothetical protein
MREPSGDHAIVHPSAPSPQLRICIDVPSDTSITQTPPGAVNASRRPSGAHVRSPTPTEPTGIVFTVSPVTGSIRAIPPSLVTAIAPFRPTRSAETGDGGGINARGGTNDGPGRGPNTPPTKAVPASAPPRMIATKASRMSALDQLGPTRGRRRGPVLDH